VSLGAAGRLAAERGRMSGATTTAAAEVAAVFKKSLRLIPFPVLIWVIDSPLPAIEGQPDFPGPDKNYHVENAVVNGTVLSC